MTRTRMHLTTALALSLALGLSACGGDDSTLDGVSAEAPDSPVEMTEDPDDASGTEDGAAAAGTDTDLSQQVSAALTAMVLAEETAGGTAHEIEYEGDDGTWEVGVAVGDRSVEVVVTADGSEVLSTSEGSLDSDDASALDAAQISLAEGIEIAFAEVGGDLDSATVDEDDGIFLIEVEMENTDRADSVDVDIDSTTGEIVALDT